MDESPTNLKSLTFGQKTLELHVRAGVVADNQQRSETTVFGGGSTNISGYGGHVSGGGSTTINSRIDRFQRIFIRDASGRERTVDLENFEVPCRTGNYVSFILAMAKGKNSGYYTHFYNHATGNLIEHKHSMKSAIGRPILSAWFFFIALVVGPLFVVTMLYEPAGSSNSTLYDQAALAGGLVWLTAPFAPIIYYNMRLGARMKRYRKAVEELRKTFEAQGADPVSAASSRP